MEWKIVFLRVSREKYAIYVVQAAGEQFELEGILPPFNPFKKGQPKIDLEHSGIVFR